MALKYCNQNLIYKDSIAMVAHLTLQCCLKSTFLVSVVIRSRPTCVCTLWSLLYYCNKKKLYVNKWGQESQAFETSWLTVQHTEYVDGITWKEFTYSSFNIFRSICSSSLVQKVGNFL